MSLVGDRHQVTLLIFKIPEKVSSRGGGCWRPTGGRAGLTPVYELLSSILPPPRLQRSDSLQTSSRLHISYLLDGTMRGVWLSLDLARKIRMVK